MEHGLTISLHHTTQKVQIQGGSKMADGSTAAVFALNNFFTDIFKSRAKEHKDTIDQFNSALIDLAQRKAEKANGNGNIWVSVIVTAQQQTHTPYKLKTTWSSLKRLRDDHLKVLSPRLPNFTALWWPK